MGDPAPLAPRPSLLLADAPLDRPQPAPPAGRTSVAVRLASYVAVAVVCLAVPLVGYRFDAVSLSAPLLYDEDALLILPMVKATIERGSHWRTERLGAPGIQEMHDFPVIDHLHFAGVWLLGRFVPDAVVVFNLYYLLGYPLAGLTAMIVLRHFGLRLFPAAVGGVLYAVQPYHSYRGELHYFLSAYFFVPITCMVILWVMQGRLPFFPLKADGRRPFRLGNRDTIAGVLIGVGTASAGAYYAFFGAGLLLAAGLYGWVALRTWRAAASAGLLIGVVVAAGLANHAPTFWYQAKNGRHTVPTERFSEESELYGLKFTQLLLPMDDHRLKLFSDVKRSYNSYDRPAQAPTERYSLGLIASAGVLLLLVRSALHVRRAAPYTELGAITLFAILIGTVGGFGAVFNHLVSPQVRCYNRIAIYIAFFALYAVLHALDGLVARVEPRLPRFAVPAFWVTLAVVGVLDQTPITWGDALQRELVTGQQDRFRTDRQFYQEIETALNPDGVRPGPAVFQLPYMRWPEGPPLQFLSSYEHARGYVHTDTLRWSFGCMKGRETDEWYRHAATLPVEQMLERVAAAGFEGLLLDKRGYNTGEKPTPGTKGDQLEQQIGRVLGDVPKVVHPHKDQVFFDLRKYRHWLKTHYGSGWEQRCEQELNRVRVLWLAGFTSFEAPGYEWRRRWCRPKGLAVFVNPADRPQTITTQFYLRTMIAEPGVLSVRGGELWTEDLTIDPDTPLLTRTFVVPPGRHSVRFAFAVPDSYVPHDGRWLVFYFSGFRPE